MNAATKFTLPENIANRLHTEADEDGQIRLFCLDLMELGIEEIRAEYLTDMGMEYINTDGSHVYVDGVDTFCSIPEFVEDVMAEPFDYESGEFI